MDDARQKNVVYLGNYLEVHVCRSNLATWQLPAALPSTGMSLRVLAEAFAAGTDPVEELCKLLDYLEMVL